MSDNEADEQKSDQEQQPKDSDLDSDEEEKPKKVEKKYKHKTEKGRRMARCIGDWILNRYFFPDIKDKKRITALKNMFNYDM